MKRLFLDDIRMPEQCVHYMHLDKTVGVRNPEYIKEKWDIVRNYKEFTDWIKTNGLPDLISFDHDLAAIHYNPQLIQEQFTYEEETGYDCAKWLVDYCIENEEKLPEYWIHSMNPVGAENIKSLIDNFKKIEK